MWAGGDGAAGAVCSSARLALTAAAFPRGVGAAPLPVWRIADGEATAETRGLSAGRELGGPALGARSNDCEVVSGSGGSAAELVVAMLLAAPLAAAVASRAASDAATSMRR